MSSEITSNRKSTLVTSEEWDKMRYHFQDSVMATTSLSNLAKDMGTRWPLRGKDETPEKYIGHSLEALGELPEFYGKGNRLPLLFSILKETLALDDPFSEMASQIDDLHKEEDDALLALKELEIPVGLPVSLGNFSTATMNLCQVEGIRTIGHFVEFAQQSAKTVIISGDYRSFLNALVERDLESLSRFLPVRKGAQGIYLAESIGHLASQITDRQAASLIAAYQLSTTKVAWDPEKALSKNETIALISYVKQQVSSRLDLMPEQAQQLRHAVQSGDAACVRFFISLGDADMEILSQAIAMAALDVKPRFKGFFGRILS